MPDPEEKKPPASTTGETAPASTVIQLATEQNLVWPPQAYNSTMDWNMWEESLEIYFLGKNVVTETGKRILLLNTLGLETLSSLIKWCHPRKPRDMTYPDLIAKLREKFAWKKNTFAARLKMSNEKQGVDQSEQDYIRQMTRLAADSDATERETILDILRGMRNMDIKRYLLRPENKCDTVAKLQEAVQEFLLHEQAMNSLLTSAVQMWSMWF
uniref:Retrotransposon gag domain-containing protein n=1 Tax=Panagrolaimus davidi TaxID=227884 RepID=A0A914PMF2_9BILA